MNKKQLKVTFEPLEKVDKEKILELMNHPLVLRQMPLASKEFTEADYSKFLSTKRKLWDQHGYGPWAFFVEGEFAGWGGLQFENGDPDLAMVLHPKFWGIGKLVYAQLLKQAFIDHEFESITVLLPPSRNHSKALLKLHFVSDGELQINNTRFLRYRLHAKDLPKDI